MAYTQTLAMHQQYRDAHTTVIPPIQRRQTSSKQRFVADLSQCLFDFVIQLLPTQEEMAVKEDVRKLLERLIRTIEPDSRLLSFGSTANGFSLRNSDMDLCCLIDSEERLAATDLVTMLGDLLERETKFHVKPLPHARIPIVKLSLDPSPGLPLGIACDIGFENRLALENTRLLMCYALIDPTRVRTIVLFLKVWSKRRKINSPYKGTLSSYGYVLLVIYFLVHVKNPPVLPNLQQMPPLRPISEEDTHIHGHNIWFFDDIDLLRQRWHSENNESVAELLIDFFRYYSRDFLYNTGVASIRAGLLKKDLKGWQNDLSARYNDARERNRFCIEDPFEIDYNVARCVTKDGLYTIRGEFMRASRILASRPDRAIVALAELCEERKDEELIVAPPFVSKSITLPPQTPYTVGNQTMRPKVAERFSPPTQFFEPGPAARAFQPATLRPPPDHMAPKRGKWTSPPPPEAPSADHTLFESQLGIGLQLATSSSEAREKDTACNSSESNSENFTDDGSDVAEDDIKSVRSYTEGSSTNASGPMRRPTWHNRDSIRPQSTHDPLSPGPSSTTRGRSSRTTEQVESLPPTAFRPPHEPTPTSRFDLSRRSTPGRPRSLNGPWTSNASMAPSTPLPPSPDSPMDPRFSDPSNVFYQTTTRSPRPTVLYPSSGTHSLLSQYQSLPIVQPPLDSLPENFPPSLSSLNPRAAGRSSGGPDTPTPASYSTLHSQLPPTPASPSNPSLQQQSRSNSPVIPSKYHSSSPKLSSTPHRAIPPSNTTVPDSSPNKSPDAGSPSPQPSGTNSDSSSPAPSSAGYSASISRSPSPISPPPTAVPFPLKQKEDNGLSDLTSLSASNIQVDATSNHLPRVPST